MKLYCDMDGVLVDFVKGAKAIYPDFTERNDGGMTKVQEEEFWNTVHLIGPEFWANLDWLKTGKTLYSYISQYDPILLSSPSQHESSKVGKKLWVKRNLPLVPLILIEKEKKATYADPFSILIDDNEETINSWLRAGGLGVFHENLLGTLIKVEQYVENINDIQGLLGTCSNATDLNESY